MRLSSLIPILALAATGCDDGGGGSPAALTATEDAAVADGCPDWTDDLIYGESNGLSAQNEAGDVLARIVRASHVPANKGPNEWSLRLEDADGEALDASMVSWACAFMPLHGHSWSPALAEGDEPARFELSDLRLWMEGGWEVQLMVDAKDAGVAAYMPTASCARPDAPSRLPDMTFRVCVPRQ